MIKKYLPALFVVMVASLFVPKSYAQEVFDYTAIDPTVQVFSAQRLPNGQVNTLGSGSATLIDPYTILTNWHVIWDDFNEQPLDAFYIGVMTDDQLVPETTLTAKLVAHSEQLDLAILKIDSEDIFGNPVPELPFLEPAYDLVLEEGDEITAIGFPDIGAGTQTRTTGNVSGFIESNESRYAASDAVISFGNSGGSVIYEGAFAGVPTFGISSGLNSLGYFLVISEAEEWIETNRNGNVISHPEAESILKEKLARFVLANQNGRVSYDTYPGFQVDIPEDWEFTSIQEGGLQAAKINSSDGLQFDVLLQKYPFPLTQAYLDDLYTRLDAIEEQAPDYEREEINFNGLPAFKVTYTGFQENTLIYIDMGYVMVVLSYATDVNKPEQKTEMQTILDSVTFLQERSTQSDPVRQISFENPHFSLSVPSDWAMIRGTQGNTLLEIDQQDNPFGMITLSYGLLSPFERNLSPEERLELETEFIEEYGKLVYQNAEVMVDGLPVILYIEEYQDPNYFGVKRRALTALIRNDIHEYIFYYDDRADTFETNSQSMIEILSALVIDGDRPSKGRYEIGSFQPRFIDTENHIYEDEINRLAEEEVLQGFSGGYYFPNQFLTRAEMLTGTLKALQKIKEKNGETLIRFSDYDRDSDFDDSKNIPEHWFNRYVVYANEEGYIDGYGDGTFGPHDVAAISHGLKIVFEINSVPVYEGESNPWYEKYTEAAFREFGQRSKYLSFLFLITKDVSQPMTRGQFAALLDMVLDDALQ